MGPVNVRLAKQQGVTPNEKILGCCGEVKCCMRYEHDTYKEFKQRAPFRNSTVKLGDREGKVVDYSMVKDSVFVQFGSRRADQELISLGSLARDNPGIMPADTDEWEVAGTPPKARTLNAGVLDNLCDVPGVLVGHATHGKGYWLHRRSLRGPGGAVVGVDVRGSSLVRARPTASDRSAPSVPRTPCS